MYKFLKENFSTSSHFMRVASKSACIEWVIETGEIISSDGLHLVPGLNHEIINEKGPKKLHINNFIPEHIYSSVLNKAEFFFRLQNRKINKNYILAFAINYVNCYNESQSGLQASMKIMGGSGMASLTLTHTEALNNLNSRIMIIAEIITTVIDKILGVVSLDNQSNTILKNYEYDILQLIAQGYQSNSISELLCLSKHTVDDCRKELLDKFKSKNIYQLIANAYQEGFI
jgi:DNA-binding CsgD family transcriptional regulator